MKLFSPPCWTNLGHIVDGMHLVWWYYTFGKMNNCIFFLLYHDCAGPVHYYYYYFYDFINFIAKLSLINNVNLKTILDQRSKW